MSDVSCLRRQLESCQLRRLLLYGYASPLALGFCFSRVCPECSEYCIERYRVVERARLPYIR